MTISSSVVPEELSESIKTVISQQSGLSVEDICISLSVINEEKRQEEEVEIIVHYNETGLDEKNASTILERPRH